MTGTGCLERRATRAEMAIAMRAWDLFRPPDQTLNHRSSARVTCANSLFLPRLYPDA
jgi:hypothetical protein